ncbi:TetR/AcrR family transcriptional regulator [Kitasatospora sp. LaBMicrA B282]|uniref:TetR/AcrR family transcriptional regulator n=1 Tax=Kitasatospora sp. LaBMicrA B282 TaxID=3420949 RepID=UPI003D096C6E
MAADGGQGRSARRPRGRRAQILAAAAEQFHRRGYHQVAMAEVAAAVGITAPALYRHFRGKPELLRQAVRGGLAELAAAVGAAPTVAGLAAALAVVALDQRPFATLWQRDARLLPPAERAALRRVLRAQVRAAGATVGRERPELAPEQVELLVWSALSVAGSLSYHSFAPPRRRFEQLVGQVLLAVLTAEPGGAADAPAAGPAADGAAARSGRREELLAAAVRLFDERGFDNVSTDRLGAAVGIAGPSLYKHFPAKTDLLAAALVRCRERLWHRVAPELLAAGDPAERLAAALAAYVDFACRHHHYLGAMVRESERLADPERKAALDFRRDFLRLWVELLQQARPAADKAEARIRVHAMFALVNDGVRNGPWAHGGHLAPRLHRLAHAVLGLAAGPRADAGGAGPDPGPPLGQRSAGSAVSRPVPGQPAAGT